MRVICVYIYNKLYAGFPESQENEKSHVFFGEESGNGFRSSKKTQAIPHLPRPLCDGPRRRCLKMT